MVKKYSVGALLLLASLSCVPTIMAERPQAIRAKDMSLGKLEKKDFSYKIVGAIKEDTWLWRKPLFFGNDINDEFSYIRSKIDLGVVAKHGEKTHGKPMGEASVIFSSYTYWQSQNSYTSMTNEIVSLNALDGAAMADRHRHTTVVPMAFMKEGWYKINLDSAGVFTSFPISIQAGFFFYELGRGISLGHHGDLANTHAGWEGRSSMSRFPYMPPGLLIRSEFSENVSLDLYYNKWRSNNADLGSSGILAPVFKNRVDWQTIYRGKDKDRETVAVRADIKFDSESFGKVAVQPYFSYTRAPELPIEAEADSKARLGTVGCMTEWDNNGWNVNVEVAGQFGKQQMFAWDRNTIALARDNADGKVRETYSHLRVDTGGALGRQAASRGGRAIVFGDVFANASSPVSRALNVNRNGETFFNAAGGVVQQTQGGANRNVYNSDFWGNPRFRPAYDIDYAGMMGLLDVSYKFKELPLKAAVAVAYIGGDRYPYNTQNETDASLPNEETSKTYKAFISQRGAYGGKNVESIMIFQAPAILRPVNIVNRTLMAENNFLDLSNLQFIGADFEWSPLASKKLTIKPNVLAFWEVAQLKKWDMNAQHPDPLLVGDAGSVKFILADMDIKGWYSKENASKFLGTEMNAIVSYQLFKSCKFYFKGFMFKPGQLYADLKGQPNIQGRRVNTAGKTRVLYQGTELAYGVNAGFDYKF